MPVDAQPADQFERCLREALKQCVDQREALPAFLQFSFLLVQAFLSPMDFSGVFHALLLMPILQQQQSRRKTFPEGGPKRARSGGPDWRTSSGTAGESGHRPNARGGWRPVVPTGRPPARRDGKIIWPMPGRQLSLRQRTGFVSAIAAHESGQQFCANGAQPEVRLRQRTRAGRRDGRRPDGHVRLRGGGRFNSGAGRPRAYLLRRCFADMRHVIASPLPASDGGAFSTGSFRLGVAVMRQFDLRREPKFGLFRGSLSHGRGAADQPADQPEILPGAPGCGRAVRLSVLRDVGQREFFPHPEGAPAAPEIPRAGRISAGQPRLLGREMGQIVPAGNQGVFSRIRAPEKSR